MDSTKVNLKHTFMIQREKGIGLRFMYIKYTGVDMV